MDTSHINDTCQRTGWFAGELDAPWSLDVSANDPRRTRFLFAPASSQQLEATERLLELTLPVALKTLYRLANGGFGPGAGIRGAVEGYGSDVESDETLPAEYLFRKRTAHDLPSLSLEHMEGWTQQANWLPDEPTSAVLFLPVTTWPRMLLPICDMGCMQEVCIDALSGTLYRVGRTDPFADERWCMTVESPSLEEWFLQWTRRVGTQVLGEP